VFAKTDLTIALSPGNPETCRPSNTTPCNPDSSTVAANYPQVGHPQWWFLKI